MQWSANLNFDLTLITYKDSIENIEDLFDKTRFKL